MLDLQGRLSCVQHVQSRVPRCDDHVGRRRSDERRERGAPREVFRLQSSAVPKIAREGDEWAGVDAREGSSLYRGAGGDEMSGAGACGHAGGTEG